MRSGYPNDGYEHKEGILPHTRLGGGLLGHTTPKHSTPKGYGSLEKL